MKLIKFFLLLCLPVLLLIGCAGDGAVLLSLPAYTHKEFYTEGVWQDFTDYGVWVFSPFAESKLEENPYFERVTDVEDLCSYIDCYEGRISEESELSEHYHFEKTWIDTEDYYFLYTKEGDPIGNTTYRKFDNYDLYIFDLDTWTLYFFHSNI